MDGNPRTVKVQADGERQAIEKLKTARPDFIVESVEGALTDSERDEIFQEQVVDRLIVLERNVVEVGRQITFTLWAIFWTGILLSIANAVLLAILNN